MKKHDGGITALFALVFIAAPAIVGIFLLIDKPKDYGLVFGIASAILVGGNLITYGMYKFKLLAIDAFTFIFPLTLVFFGLYATMYEAGGLMLVVAVVGILMSFPANIVVANIKEKKEGEIKEKAKKKIEEKNK